MYRFRTHFHTPTFARIKTRCANPNLLSTVESLMRSHTGYKPLSSHLQRPFLISPLLAQRRTWERRSSTARTALGRALLGAGSEVYGAQDCAEGDEELHCRGAMLGRRVERD